MPTAALKRQAANLIREAKAALSPRAEADPHAFAGRPVEYAERVLRIRTLTEEQKQILRLLHEAPYRVLVPSAHDQGKTYVAAVAANYWYDSFNPGLVLTTAPTERDVNELLWTELRLQRQRAGLDCSGLAPKAAYMGDSPEHYAAGYVSRLGQGFKGRHRPRMLFIKDEADGVAPLHWITTNTMHDPALGCAELAIFNPESTTCQAYQEDIGCDDPDGEPRWSRIRLSALDHPNIRAELLGQPRPIPGAVSLDLFKRWLQDWCEPVGDNDQRRATDFEFPPSQITGKPGRWFRPGPIFQARAQGHWPDLGDGVWSPALWEACLGTPPPYPTNALPRLGVDCATGKGDDYHAIHARWGSTSFHHETANTMDPERIFNRIKVVCAKSAAMVNRIRDRSAKPCEATEIPVVLDDDGVGGALGAFLRANGYHAIQCGAATKAIDEEHYERMRDELWFNVADRAKTGRVNVALLDRQTKARLRQQLLAPAWTLRTGRQVVEPKDET